MAETTHKLLAIMFTDIEGYSTLMGQNEEKALQILEKNREIQNNQIQQFNGTLLKDMGDGTMVSFGTATEAVKCAIEIQKSAIENEIPLRIGVHLGEVTVSENDIWGDGVNIASRIEQLAFAGSVLISQTVKDEIENKGIETLELGTVKLKNISRPILVFAIKTVELVLPAKISTNQKSLLSRMPVWLIFLLAFITIASVAWLFSKTGSTEKGEPGNNILESIKIKSDSGGYITARFPTEWVAIKENLDNDEAFVIINNISPATKDNTYVVYIITSDDPQPIVKSIGSGSFIEDPDYIKFYRNSFIYQIEDSYSFNQYLKEIELELQSFVPSKKIVFVSKDGLFNQLSLQAIRVNSNQDSLIIKDQYRIIPITVESFLSKKKSNKKLPRLNELKALLENPNSLIKSYATFQNKGPVERQQEVIDNALGSYFLKFFNTDNSTPKNIANVLSEYKALKDTLILGSSVNDFIFTEGGRVDGQDYAYLIFQDFTKGRNRPSNILLSLNNYLQDYGFSVEVIPGYTKSGVSSLMPIQIQAAQLNNFFDQRDQVLIYWAIYTDTGVNPKLISDVKRNLLETIDRIGNDHVLGVLDVVYVGNE